MSKKSKGRRKNKGIPFFGVLDIDYVVTVNPPNLPVEGCLVSMYVKQPHSKVDAGEMLQHLSSVYKEEPVSSRAEKSGVCTGKSIIEMVHLMYQKNTALNFLKGLLWILVKEFIRRKRGK